MNRCEQFQVQGRVQGVFFRASTRERATALGLTGWVRNRADGTVEVLACGSPVALDSLHEWLWQGPDAARVDQVERKPAQADPGSQTGFSIR